MFPQTIRHTIWEIFRHCVNSIILYIFIGHLIFRSTSFQWIHFDSCNIYFNFFICFPVDVFPYNLCCKNFKNFADVFMCMCVNISLKSITESKIAETEYISICDCTRQFQSPPHNSLCSVP